MPPPYPPDLLSRKSQVRPEWAFFRGLLGSDAHVVEQQVHAHAELFVVLVGGVNVLGLRPCGGADAGKEGMMTWSRGMSNAAMAWRAWGWTV